MLFYNYNYRAKLERQINVRNTLHVNSGTNLIQVYRSRLPKNDLSPIKMNL